MHTTTNTTQTSHTNFQTFRPHKREVRRCSFLFPIDISAPNTTQPYQHNTPTTRPTTQPTHPTLPNNQVQHKMEFFSFSLSHQTTTKKKTNTNNTTPPINTQHINIPQGHTEKKGLVCSFSLSRHRPEWGVTLDHEKSVKSGTSSHTIFWWSPKIDIFGPKNSNIKN